MVRINLLPWREIERQRRRREFAVIAAAGLVVTLIFGLVLHQHLEVLISGQQDRNLVSAQRDRPTRWANPRDPGPGKGQRTAAGEDACHPSAADEPPGAGPPLRRAGGRSPRGIHLTRINQNGRSVVLEGRARSDTQVSTFMRNIEASQWIGRPALLLTRA